MSEIITSLQNNRIKQIVKLAKHTERVVQNLYVIEGYREIQMALKFKHRIKTLYFCPEFLKNDLPDLFLNSFLTTVEWVEVTSQVYEKIAYRDHSDGLLALGIPEYNSLDTLQLPGNPLIIVLETVEKPGNLGAVLRTADAAGVSAVIVCDKKTDIYNPNVIRSSLGCVFSNQVITCSSEEALDFFKKKGIKTFAACLQTESLYHRADFNKPSALVMGTESTGLTEFWLSNCDYKIKIPMKGTVDSLNVSTSTAVLVFEALRQRGM